eukprot:742940-Rhodomonas_salina.3
MSATEAQVAVDSTKQLTWIVRRLDIVPTSRGTRSSHKPPCPSLPKSPVPHVYTCGRKAASGTTLAGGFHIG